MIIRCQRVEPRLAAAYKHIISRRKSEISVAIVGAEIPFGERVMYDCLHPR